MTVLAHLADRVLGAPLLITPEKFEIILGVLGGRIGLAEAFNAPAPEASRFIGQKAQNGRYNVTANGVAVIPIIGSLVNRGAYVGAASGLVSYEGISEQLKAASEDSSVRGILLDMNTPGGEAAGTFDVSKQILEIRKKKPVVAWVNAMACSAGYAIASACNMIYTSQSGALGSIGVVWVHFDRSEQMAAEGIRPTILHAGARKADGNPFGPLSNTVKANFQAEIDKLYDQFVATVAEGRPNLKPAAIRDTEAAVFMGEDAVALGLADGVSTLDRVLDVMGRKLSGLPPSPAGYDSKPKEKADMTDTPAADAASAPDQAQLDAARAEGLQAGVAQERTRIAGILTLPEAKDRHELALELATGSDMSVEQSAKILAKAPTNQPAAAGKAFYDAMANNGGKPGVSTTGAADAPQKTRAQANIERARVQFKQFAGAN